MENNKSGVDNATKRTGSKRTASCSPRGTGYSPRNQAQSRKSSRNDGGSGDGFPKSSSPLRSPLSPSRQNGNRRSSRDPSNAWSKPLVFRQKEEEKSQISPRCLNFPAESTSASASSASTTASDEGASGDLASVRDPLATSSRRSSTPRGGDGGVGNRGGGGDADSVSSIKSKRAGSPDSGLHHSPAPSHGNRSSEERHGSRSRNNSGSSSSCLETISTMNESKDWNSIVEDRELLEFELSEHVDRIHEKLVMRGDTPIPSKEELMNTMETDIDVIARRKKQISYGKNTKAYSKYIQTVPKYCRTKGVHPQTPDKYKKLSRRSFDSLVKRWKQDIASWDPAAQPPGQRRSSASSLNSSLEGSTDYPSAIVLRSRDNSKKRPLEEEPVVSTSNDVIGIDETSQDSCASTVELMSEASLASPVKKSHIASNIVPEARAGPGADDLRLRLRNRLNDISK